MVTSADPAGACNPTVVEPTFTVSDNCGVTRRISVSTDGPETSDNCSYNQTWTANVSDDCDNPADPVSVTDTISSGPAALIF